MTSTRYANGCYALRDANTDRFVVRDALGYAATAPTAAAATPFRLQATALGRYLLYGPDARMPSGGALDAGLSDRHARAGGGLERHRQRRQAAAHERVHRAGTSAWARRTGSSRSLRPTPALVVRPAQGCATFPEVEVNIKGQPFKGPRPTARVRGFVDDHIHIGAFQFLGGRFHCGRPWSPYGVTVAMQDCVDHQPDGAGAVAEVFLSGGTPGDTHSTEGWPSFAGWPRDESLTHEGTYWKWIERSWRAGLRIMVNDLVENRALCEIYPLKQNNCNEMTSAYQQADDMHALQDYIDAQFGGPGKGFLRIVKSPTEARKVINAGKLAMVLGVEVSEVLNCGQLLDMPNCNDDADRRPSSTSCESIGVQSLFPVHKFDNALGGTHYDSGTTGVLVNAGNKYATGEFWNPEHCDDADHDNEPTNPTGEYAAQFSAIFGPVLINPLFQGQLPVYPPAPLCNPQGPDPARRVHDPGDDAPRHDHRDRPPEREGAPGGAGRSSRPTTTIPA